jgi:hypothetical protein
VRRASLGKSKLGVIDSLFVNHDRGNGVAYEILGREERAVWLSRGRGDLHQVGDRSREDAKPVLAPPSDSSITSDTTTSSILYMILSAFASNLNAFYGPLTS